MMNDRHAGACWQEPNDRGQKCSKFLVFNVRRLAVCLFLLAFACLLTGLLHPILQLSGPGNAMHHQGPAAAMTPMGRDYILKYNSPFMIADLFGQMAPIHHVPPVNLYNSHPCMHMVPICPYCEALQLHKHRYTDCPYIQPRHLPSMLRR